MKAMQITAAYVAQNCLRQKSRNGNPVTYLVHQLPTFGIDAHGSRGGK